MNWQPIETAPKDGRSVLGYAGEKMAVVSWYAGAGYWDLDVAGAWAENGEWGPTHWMPLPAPPEAQP